jgi:ABC-2 type transport system permease protein
MKTKIIIQREYLSRVKKKSFIIMTLAAPLLMATFMVVYSYLLVVEDKEEKTIGILDESTVLFESLKNDDYLKFELLAGVDPAEIKNIYAEKGYYAVLYIPANVTNSLKVQLFSEGQPSQSVVMTIHNSLSTYLEDKRLMDEGLSKQKLESLKVNLSVDTIKWGEDGTIQQSSTDISMNVGMLSGLLIYMFIFMYGVQVMRGIIEEKTSRIIEVIVSSVKPFQLMMGKIIGIAMVGLTQFIAWIVLIFIFYSVGMSLFGPDYDAASLSQQAMSQDIMNNSVMNEIPIAQENSADIASDVFGKLLATINFPVMIISFLFYFIGGYLLYSSLFAAIGSAVDNETDTQQFMAPVTIPLIIAIMVMMNAIRNPDGAIAFWCSIIPFTSPVVMMGRIPFGVPYWQLALSAVLLIATFLFTTWMAGRIYRTGILMYGKKVNYKELWKWIRY